MHLGDEELLIALANTAHTETDELADGDSLQAWWYAMSKAPKIRSQILLLRRHAISALGTFVGSVGGASDMVSLSPNAVSRDGV